MELSRLMLVTDRGRTRGRELLPLVVEAAQAGVGLVQLREKDLPDAARRELARALRRALPEATTLVVNGQAAWARRMGLGTHLPAAAKPRRGRRSATPFGRSVHDVAELEAALTQAPDYLVMGHVFPSVSKAGLPAAGLAALGTACRRAAPVPVFGIGGITVSRVPDVLHAGAFGVAVCGAILGATSPGRVAQALALAIAVAVRAVPATSAE